MLDVINYNAGASFERFNFRFKFTFLLSLNREGERREYIRANLFCLDD